ncbi:MAG: hypothetical protein ABIH34_03325 [Nanoarchaeota archaeon]
MKRGQGLSMNVIIIAALALLVLVVLAVVFINRTTPIIEETDLSNLCETTLGGECVRLNDCGGATIGKCNNNALDEPEVCCKS